MRTEDKKAKLWLAEKFNGMFVGPMIDVKYFVDLGGERHTVEFPNRNILMYPDRRERFLHAGAHVFLLGRTPNPYLQDAIKLFTRIYPHQVSCAARAFGVDEVSCTPYTLAAVPWIFVEALPDVKPDGKRTIFKLTAMAIRKSLRQPTR